MTLPGVGSPVGEGEGSEERKFRAKPHGLRSDIAVDVTLPTFPSLPQWQKYYCTCFVVVNEAILNTVMKRNNIYIHMYFITFPSFSVNFMPEKKTQ